MAAPRRPSEKERWHSAAGLPLGELGEYKIYSPWPFAGLAQAASRMAIPDPKFWWIENLVKVGDGNLRSVRDNGPNLYTAPTGKQIVNFFHYNIGVVEYVVVFLNDGTAYQVNATTGVTTVISSVVNTFYKSGLQLTGCSQFAAQYLLMSNNITQNSYWVWDGGLLYTAGSVSPQITVTNGGIGYTSVPTVTAYGGEGTGSTYLATINSGSVTNIVVMNPGTGYQPGDQVQLRISGGGSDNGAQLMAELNANLVASATVNSGGSGYTPATTVTITGGGGTGVTAIPQITAGVITAIIITNGGNSGSGFTSIPTITITDPGGGFGATATANLSGLVISSISVTNGGSGFTSAPTVTINGGGGTGATAVAFVAGGQIVSVEVTNVGYGYFSAGLVVNYSGGGGTGATLVPNLGLNQGSVQSASVTNPGTGYTNATVAFSGGGGSGAAATATIAAGAITAIVITSGGTGYTSTPTIVISGDGASATAVANLKSGYLMGIAVVHPGMGYTSPPILTVVGGGGTGATAVATVLNGQIVAANVTNVGKNYTSTPAIVIQSGLNNGATATINLMPFGVSGTTIENFQQRVWDANPYQQTTIPVGNVFEMSATGSLSDFATSDGGLLYSATESTLKIGYTAIKQSNGYLYLFGDSEVSVISGVTVSGTPPTASFNYQNSDPQIGTPWRDSLQSYGRQLIFANNLGIFGVFGGGVSKLSDEIDDIFINAIPPSGGGVTPSGATATFFKRRLYLLLLTITDPFTKTPRNAMIGWDGKEFYILSQSTNLVYIGTQEINSQITAWGTDGTNLFPLFNSNTSLTLQKILSTKLYGADSMILNKLAMGLYIQATDLSGTGAGINFSSITMDNELASYQIPNSVSIISPNPQHQLYPTGSGDVIGVNLGCTLMSSSPFFGINYLGIGYLHWSGIFGGTVQQGEPEE